MDKANGQFFGSETFNKNEDAMKMIEYLTKKKPLQQGVKFYNLYRGADVITYSELSAGNISNIGQLNDTDNATLYFAVEDEPKFWVVSQSVESSTFPVIN